MNTREKILNLAKKHSQKAGFRGFSYKDIAEELGIKTAAIHYHFPKKEDLGTSMAKEYVASLKMQLAEKARSLSGEKRIEFLIGLFRNTVIQNKLCLCTSLATDHMVLPDSMTIHANSFFVYVEKWMYQALADASQDRSLKLNRDPLALASEFITLVYGAMLIAQSKEHVDHFDAVMTNWVESNLVKQA